MSDIVSPRIAEDFTVSLRVRHPSIDPGEITRALGLEPQHGWKAGDARRTAQGQRLEGAYHETYWTGEFSEHTMGLLGVMTTEAVLLQVAVQLRRSQQFLSRLQKEGATIELFVEVFGGNEFTFSLSPQLLSMLARCGVSVALQVHGDSQTAVQRKVG